MTEDAKVGRLMKAQAFRDNMSLYMVSTQRWYSIQSTIMCEFMKKAVLDKYCNTAKDLVWLVFDMWLLTIGVNCDEPVLFAGRIRRMTILGLSVGDDDFEGGDELPPLVEVEVEMVTRGMYVLSQLAPWTRTLLFMLMAMRWEELP